MREDGTSLRASKQVRNVETTVPPALLFSFLKKKKKSRIFHPPVHQSVQNFFPPKAGLENWDCWCTEHSRMYGILVLSVIQLCFGYKQVFQQLLPQTWVCVFVFLCVWKLSISDLMWTEPQPLNQWTPESHLKLFTLHFDKIYSQSSKKELRRAYWKKK